MSTRAVASAVFPNTVEDVWKVVRDFSAVPKRFTSVEGVDIEAHSHHSVGATRTIRWKTGEKVEQRLLELSDQFHRVVYETVATNFEAEASASISTIRLFRITENKTTLVEWSTEYAADVAPKTVALQQTTLAQNLKDLRESFKH